ncbi:MAG: hypothetical protein KDC53_05640, partial [Saprospiraceae bacterium]|nr:hypothetical protein [Saprospiraceae bacterium]
YQGLTRSSAFILCFNDLTPSLLDISMEDNNPSKEFQSLVGPITVPSSTLPAIGDKLRYSWAYGQGTFDMVTAPGFDLIWDFSGLTADENLTEEYLPPSEGVHVARFPAANLMTRNAAGEERYYIVSSSGLRLIGYTKNTLFGEPFTVVYDYTWKGTYPDPGLNERYTPLNFFDSYARHASILEGYQFSELPPALRNTYLAAGLTTTDSIRLRYSYDNYYAVNANGTLTIPGQNGQYEVLRMNTTLYSEKRVDAHVIPLGWLDITDITMQYFPASIPSLGIDTTGTHVFFNDVTKEEIARVILDSQGRPHDVRYKNNSPVPCFDPDLVNATLNGDPISGGTYLASQTITSAGRIANGTTVQFSAGGTITLQPNFLAETGSIFSADVITCPVNAAAPSMVREQIQPQLSFQSKPTLPTEIPKLLIGDSRLKVYTNSSAASIKIGYTLTDPGPVWLAVADTKGVLLKVLEETDRKEAGHYSLAWKLPENYSGKLNFYLKTKEGVVWKR